jgi:hypothetical protein
MALPRRTDVLKLPTRDCAARSDLLNAEDGEAEPRLSTGEKAEAKRCLVAMAHLCVWICLWVLARLSFSPSFSLGLGVARKSS